MSCGEYIDTLLLIALPASGKSEVRNYLMNEPLGDRIQEYHIADNAQLDDFPYVHFMRRIDEELVARGQERAYYLGEHDRFRYLADWGTLLQLVNDDYEVLRHALATPSADPELLFRRLDLARLKLDGPVVFQGMDHVLRCELAEALRGDAAYLNNELWGQRPDTIEGKTIVIEFARGGPDKAPMPLGRPHGYGWCLGNLSPAILERAAVLYIWVTPEESRRKNDARYDPTQPGSSLFHKAPDVVMYGDYGCDDIKWLCKNAQKKNTIPIQAHGRTWHLPFARFDNRVDKTTFLRQPAAEWSAADKQTIRDGLLSPMQDLWAAYKGARHG